MNQSTLITNLFPHHEIEFPGDEALKGVSGVVSHLSQGASTQRIERFLQNPFLATYPLAPSQTGKKAVEVHDQLGSDVCAPNHSTRESVTVVIPTRDRPHCLQRSINSVLAQTHPFFELIVVNDSCRTLDTERTLTRDARVRVIELGGTFGANRARNVGLHEAAYSRICFLDDDDVLSPFFLNEMLLTHSDPTGFSYSGTTLAIENEKGMLRYNGTIWSPFSRTHLENANFITMISAMFNTDLMRDLGGFNPNLTRFQDWEMFVRLGRVCIPRTTPLPIAMAIRSPLNTSITGSTHRRESAIARRNVRSAVKGLRDRGPIKPLLESLCSSRYSQSILPSSSSGRIHSGDERPIVIVNTESRFRANLCYLRNRSGLVDAAEVRYLAKPKRTSYTSSADAHGARRVQEIGNEQRPVSPIDDLDFEDFLRDGRLVLIVHPRFRDSIRYPSRAVLDCWRSVPRTPTQFAFDHLLLSPKPRLIDRWHARNHPNLRIRYPANRLCASHAELSVELTEFGDTLLTGPVGWSELVVVSHEWRGGLRSLLASHGTFF